MDYQNLLAILVLILNVVLVDGMLSFDNAAVLAVMVRKLPEAQRNQALKYGIFGAFAFRFIGLLLTSWLVKFWFLKVFGGLYLCYLTFDFFMQKKEEEETGDTDKEDGVVSRFFKKTVGLFWGTVIMVEIADISFSLDNLLAVNALSKNIYVIMAGIVLAILIMRFIAQKFVVLLEKYPSLETTAMIVIALLGVKLALTGVLDGLYKNYGYHSSLNTVLENEHTDMLFSVALLVIFAIPILYTKFLSNKSATVSV